MTFPGGSAILLLFILATSLLGVAGQDVVLPSGKVNEGEALELFFKYTLPGSDFEANRTCDWNETRVTCDSQHSTVLELQLSGLNLTGDIPAGSITNLTGLQSLDLSNNHLTGKLPEVYNLINLSALKLSGNSFNGSLSNENFPGSLLSLDLTRNEVTGSIPSSLLNLKGLASLKLGSNSLEGRMNVTALTASPSLQTLDLSNNSLSGDLPQQLFWNMSLLDLHDNQFEGNVMELINSLKSMGSSNLSVLDLSSNKFDLQTFPSDFSHLINLTTLGLAGNKYFSHSFPSLPTTITILNLSGTNLLGNIPDAICDIDSLVFLDLSNNNLEGTIPMRLGDLHNLERLDLSRNNLSGQFPPSMNNLTFLSYLNVSYNNLSGSIPSGTQFSTFPNTSYLGGNPGLCGPSLRKCNSSTSGNDQTTGKKKSKDIVVIFAGSVSGVVLVFLVAVILFVWCRVSRAVKPLAKDETRNVSGPMLFEKDAETWATRVKDPSSIMVVMFEKPLLNLSFADLLLATGNFSKEMQIADGGYGPVYKGVLPDATQLAVKVLVDVGLDAISDEKYAVARIDRLAKVKHSNLVPLVGYCLVGEDCVLIYEYMVNGDLQRWLHELPEGTRNPEDWSLDTWEHLEGVEVSGEYLSWPTRHKIALGIARALAFLHHGCSPHIIHRDVKSSNILLDDGFNAFLVDSGLACTARINGTPIIGGTLGYVPPEYGQTWQATTRGDVYSFGVVLLELVTGRKPTGHYFHDSYGGNLLGWVRSMIKQDKRGQKALDPKLVSRGHVPEMLEVLRIGYLCTTETPAKRPSMQQVVGLLKDCQSG